MKVYKNIKLFLAIVVFLGFTACNFEDINTRSYEVTDAQAKGDNVDVGGKFTQMQKAVIPIGTFAEGTGPVNNYQISDNLAGDCWAGYFGINHDFDNGNNNTTFFLVGGWINGVYDRMYKDIFTPWLKVVQETDEDNERFALAQILKISSWHRAADAFGPIPYKNAEKGSLHLPYNSQKEVYQSFFDDLTQSIKVLTEYASVGNKILPDYDAVYEGDTTKWVKYANSLMLRLAMRVVYADPAMAKKYAEQAVNHSIGVMTAQDDGAKMRAGAGLEFQHPISVIANQYNDIRMGSPIYSFLNGYNDPRLPAYFKQGAYNNVKGYYAVSAGNTEPKNEDYTAFSKPNIEGNTPLYWIKTSEVLFLKSEGALRGWNMGGGTAKSYYEEGVKMSFQENGVTGADTYLQNNSSTPASYTDPKTSYTFSASTDLTIQWNEADSMEKKLERIITQKWLALFPQGQEAWSEWRRTGYPKFPLYNGNSLVVENRSGGLINSKQGIRRMSYPGSEYVDNKENVLKAVSLLGGPDNGATRLWWDKKPFN